MQTHIIKGNIANYIQMHIVYAVNIELYVEAYSSRLPRTSCATSRLCKRFS